MCVSLSQFQKSALCLCAHVTAPVIAVLLLSGSGTMARQADHSGHCLSRRRRLAALAAIASEQLCMEAQRPRSGGSGFGRCHLRGSLSRSHACSDSSVATDASIDDGLLNQHGLLSQNKVDGAREAASHVTLALVLVFSIALMYLSSGERTVSSQDSFPECKVSVLRRCTKAFAARGHICSQLSDGHESCSPYEVTGDSSTSESAHASSSRVQQRNMSRWSRWWRSRCVSLLCVLRRLALAAAHAAITQNANAS